MDEDDNLFGHINNDDDDSSSSSSSTSSANSGNILSRRRSSSSEDVTIENADSDIDLAAVTVNPLWMESNSSASSFVSAATTGSAATDHIRLSPLQQQPASYLRAILQRAEPPPAEAGAYTSNSDDNAVGTAVDLMEEEGAVGGARPTFFATSPSFSLHSRKEVAALVNAECCRGGPTPELDAVLDKLFNSATPIYNTENIEWIRWLIAGGRTPQEFVKIVRSYDNHAKCGLVWVPHVVAYRCRTCGISPCMSICRDCFKKGNHANHDFNMFLSQAGGACDCGDTSVMKPEGFCTDHGINDRANKEPVPASLLAVAEAIMPKLLFRLLQHFRESSTTQSYNMVASSCEEFGNMLIDLNNMGEIMRKVMTRALINKEIYKQYNDTKQHDTARHIRFLKSNRDKYNEAVFSFPRAEPPEEYKHLPALGEKLVHTTLLEEFIFWTFKFEFPQNLVCFLLNMLPDQDYKEHLTRTFVMHYSRIPCVLEMSRDPDTLSNRVVHMSVQLFSNESLALKMVNELSLLHVMIISLKLMMSKILVQSTLHDPKKNFHFVIDCTRQVMKDHCYWPLVSDFNNVLSHESVALVFLRDNNLIDMWFQFLSMLQGMNANIREMSSHVEFEPNSYYAAFSCELEASAYPMWSIISHLKDGTHTDLARKIINYCGNTLHEWLDAIYFLQYKVSQEDMLRASFHFPLHRYMAAFLCQAVTQMGMDLNELLHPWSGLINLLFIHPLRVQSFFYEILASKWVRNGLQIKGQAMTYIQANFCNSMVDMDLFFLQICATYDKKNEFLQRTIELFGVGKWLEMAPLKAPQDVESACMLEGFLTFLATLVTSRTNLGNDDATQCIIEISALLATDNKTHSQLLELMPERSGNLHSKNFETFLKQLSVYKAPSSGSENLEQGLFTPIDEVWDKHYDPLHVLLRAVHRRDFQSSMDRFTNYVKSKDKMPASGNLWPPFRPPRPVAPAFKDPCTILNSRVFHSTILSILFRAVHSRDVSEHLLALTIFLLEMAVDNCEDVDESKNNAAIVECDKNNKAYEYYMRRGPPKLFECYPSDDLSCNLRHKVDKLLLKCQDPTITPASYRSNSYFNDLDFDVDSATGASSFPMIGNSSDDDDVALAAATHGNNAIVPLRLPNMEVVLPEQALILRNNAQRNETLREHRRRQIENGPTMGLRLALQPLSLPESGMEVAIRRDLRMVERTSPLAQQQQTEMFSPTGNAAGGGMLLPFQRPQPVAIPINSLDIVPDPRSGSLTAGVRVRRTFEQNARKRSVDNAIGGHNKNELPVDESILSLLLKLHSQLSGTLDSFSLSDGEEEEEAGEATTNHESMDIDGVEDAASTSAAAYGANGSSQRRNSRTGLPRMRNHKKIRVCESRIGDGPYFIGNLLRKIAKRDQLCANTIDQIRLDLWPNQREKQAEQKAHEEKEKEEKRKRARERQRKVMQEMMDQQMKFKEENTENMEEDYFEEFEQPREKEYDCIICNRTSPSTETNPVGMVVLVESSGIVGHRRRTAERLPLPLSPVEEERLKHSTRLATEFNRRAELLSLKFGEESWYLSNNMNYENGVHVQSCGHHVHLSCLDSYLRTLYATQRQHPYEHGEFYCPVCRQLSNSVLPLSPQLDRPTPVVRSGTQPFEMLVRELANLIKENEKPSTSTKLSEAMGRAMENMTNTTHRQSKRVQPTFRSLFIFVTSIARTNLESEIIQRGGTLCSTNPSRYRAKRDCIVPLLHVLSVHVRVLVDWPLWRSWASLAGLPPTDHAPVPSHCRESIPNILADPIAMLLKYILLAPLHMGQEYFTCMVRVTYNMLYYQIVMQLCITLTELETEYVLQKYSDACDEESLRAARSATGAGSNNCYLGSAMALVLKNTAHLEHLRRDSIPTTSASSRTAVSRATVVDNANSIEVNLKAMELQLQSLCLPFLRIAALLRQHLYQHEMPEITAPGLEFVRLIYYLELVTDSMDWDCFNASKGLCFIPNTEMHLPRFWCQQLMDVRPPTDTVRELFLINQHAAWQQPKLLQLPREYERLFTYYHERPCLNCNKVPKESSICLLCGTIVCLKQSCCSENECCEAVRHTISCGGGIGIFLVVTSTYIIVIRGRRACLWGSLYLDDFDEEDRDLKRGKPLYLSQDRFNLLESQWLSHKFANTKHTWVFHRDLL